MGLLFPKRHDRRARAAFIRRRSIKPFDVSVAGQKLGDRSSQRALAVAVNYTHSFGACHVRFIQELVDAISSLIHRRAYNVYLGRKMFIHAYLGTDAARQPGSKPGGRGCGSLQQLNLITFRAKPKRTYKHRVFAGVDRFNRAFLIKSLYFHPVAFAYFGKV